ncbi:MAG: hypothetical protein SVM79_06195 [Chloroflexota bacterium]|nr:hypothetical protein [Chloroflexota bacterium]
MAIWVSSDWHCDQNKLKDSVINWITLGKEDNHRLIGDGDLFDILPLGREKWDNAASIQQLAELLDGYPFDYVAGNHDPYNTMKKLMAPYSNITLHKRLDLEEDGRQYFITHGHRWAVDWGFLGLRHIAPWIVEKMVDIAPGLWYGFCRRVGWLAHPGADEEIPGKESEQITKLTRVIWAGASDHALKNGCCVIIGHTHTTGRREKGISKKVGFQAYMVDDGDLPDGSYVEITDDARLMFLDG